MPGSTRVAALAAAAVALAAPSAALAGGNAPAPVPAPATDAGGSPVGGLEREIVAGLFGVAAAATGGLLARRRSARSG
jgi:hypothetical protein